MIRVGDWACESIFGALSESWLTKVYRNPLLQMQKSWWTPNLCCFFWEDVAADLIELPVVTVLFVEFFSCPR